MSKLIIINNITNIIISISVLGGILGFDFTDDTVIQIIRAVAKELLNPERVDIEKEENHIDASTLQLLVNTYEKVISLNKLTIHQEPEIYVVANIVKKFKTLQFFDKN